VEELACLSEASVDVRLSALNFCALTLRTVDRSPRLLGKPGSLIERCSI
jgi:hypothetical protein